MNVSPITHESKNEILNILKSREWTLIVLSTWKSIDLLGNREFRDTLCSCLEKNDKKSIEILVGGMNSDLDVVKLLKKLSCICNDTRFAELFVKSRIRFLCDYNVGKSESFSVHSKFWAVYKGDVLKTTYIGSHNLSQKAFRSKYELGVILKPASSRNLSAKIKAIRNIFLNAISPKEVMKNSKEITAIKEDSQTDNLKKKHSFKITNFFTNAKTIDQKYLSSKPRLNVTDLSDWLLVLRDPSRGERTSIQLNKNILKNILGIKTGHEKAANLELNLSGRLLPITDKHAHILKKINSKRSSIISQNCKATSIGYVLNIDKKAEFEKKLIESDPDRRKLISDLRKFKDSEKFRFLVLKIATEALYERKEVKEMSRKDIRKQLESENFHNEAKSCISKIISKLEEDKLVSYINLELVVNDAEGAPRDQICKDLNVRQSFIGK